MTDATCSTPGCGRPVWVKSTGECSTCQSSRYRRDNPGRGRTTYSGTCEHCGIDYTTKSRSTRYCSLSCAGFANPGRRPRLSAIRGPQLKLAFDQRSDLRAGYEDEDWNLVLTAIRRRVNVDSASGCWNWLGRLRDGYPCARIGGKYVQVHRMAIEATHRACLGDQAAHHKCANTECVNPDHLQPVTHCENVAEMLARSAYLSRIAALEQALVELVPNHPLLKQVRVA